MVHAYNPNVWVQMEEDGKLKVTLSYIGSYIAWAT